MTGRLIDAISSMKEKEALDITKALLESKIDPMEILDASSKAMEIVGKRFELGEYFLSELMMSGAILKQVSEMVKPMLKGEVRTKKRGKVLIGTVKGDIHDIGKDIVVFLLDVNGFEVRDLGIDVPPERFVEQIGDFQPQVVGLSGLLTLAYDAMKHTVQTIQKAGLRDSVKIMIGGGQMSTQVKEYVGADAFGNDGMAAVALAKDWIGGQ
ncbi:MAG: cobalamin-dependent protein [Desulfatiglandaceae bacterium]|jgi:trimethylamine corrinoid protein